MILLIIINNNNKYKANIVQKKIEAQAVKFSQFINNN